MLQTRQELYEQARKTYISLFERMVKRFSSDYQYVVSDQVGYSCTKIEDFFRPMWGLAAILKTESFDIDVNGQKIKVTDFINRVLLDGVREDSPTRFDKNVAEDERVSFSNQTITEIAAYLVAVYFARGELWDALPPNDREAIASWIKKWAIYAIKHSWRNNHYWYPIFCIEILKQLGFDCSEADEDLKAGYDFLESLYYSNGWYNDGEIGRFDYYEAWAHHTYTLLWILIADKSAPGYEEKCEKYRQRSAEFLKYYIHYFDSDGGMVAYGRSIGYRFAAVAPFALAAIVGCDIDAGLCKNVVLKNISYFYDNSIAAEDGCFPVGYLYESAGLSEKYASDGAISCYTEGFLALLADEDSPLWRAEVKPLPIETKNYVIHSPLKKLLTVIEGNSVNGVTLYNNALHYYQDKVFTHKFNDMAGAYSKFVYNSRSGFGLSVCDTVSFDNMISLATGDGIMESHRRKIERNMLCDGIMVSEHTPFSNDESTKIKTWMLPLENGYHLRVHQVKLSRPYIVREGGFSIGVQDDSHKFDRNAVTYRNMLSSIKVFSSCETRYMKQKIQPAMHILAPQAIYPAYTTDLLPAGDYIFASLIYFTTNARKAQMEPIVTFSDREVSVSTQTMDKTITL